MTEYVAVYGELRQTILRSCYASSREVAIDRMKVRHYLSCCDVMTKRQALRQGAEDNSEGVVRYGK